MSKFYLLLALLCILIFPTIGFTSTTPIQSEINVVIDDNYPPYVFYDSNHQLQEIIIDQWALFEKKTGIKVNISAMDWSDALSDMEQGKFDVIDTLFKNPKREELYLFSEPYADIDVSIFFHKNINGINTIESIKGFAVAAKRGDQAVNVLLDAGIENITLYNSYEDIIKAASNNKVVIFVIDSPPAKYYLYKYNLQDAFKYTTPLYTGQFHRAVKKSNPELLDVLKNGFNQISPFENQAIEDRWYGKSTLLTSKFSEYFRIIGIGAVIVLLLLLGWNSVLRYSVRKKTIDLHDAIENLRYNKSKLQAIIHSMPDWVFVLNRKGDVIDFLTPHKSTQLIAPLDSFIGENLDAFFDPDLVEKFKVALTEVLDHGETEPIEYEIVSDTTHYYEARYSKLSANQAISIVRDITENALAQQKILELSVMDVPTEVYNRNYFETQLHQIRKESLEGLSLLMVDFDGLKLVNDTQGHTAGDYYLKTVATLLRVHFENALFVARIGGDEFIVMMKDWTEDEVFVAKNNIQNSIMSLNEDGRLIPFSISIGFSSYGPNSSTIEEMIKTADDYMYREKLFHRQSTKSKNIEILSKMLEERDFITQGHGDRMSELAVKLAKAVDITHLELESIALFAFFHDIGKIGISDTILFKPDRLTEKEYTEMKRHTEIGYRIAESSPDLMHISEWIYKHHEWWDGNGYPFGLKGEDIPLPCRILSLVDAYDAMTNDRPYRQALTKNEALEELVKNAGTQFEPKLVNLFIEILQSTS